MNNNVFKIFIKKIAYLFIFLALFYNKISTLRNVKL